MTYSYGKFSELFDSFLPSFVCFGILRWSEALIKADSDCHMSNLTHPSPNASPTPNPNPKTDSNPIPNPNPTPNPKSIHRLKTHVNKRRQKTLEEYPLLDYLALIHSMRLTDLSRSGTRQAMTMFTFPLQIGPTSFPFQTHTRSPAFETRLLRRNSAVVGGPGMTSGIALFTLLD